ncbi:hypothetical protein HG535_0G03200 [Zygotorulaspora mrakii]|uniref:Uncharacterized protein n=1 Tax=Zygotorulaspora mrakii TaxID=42260 RepID=A0A7H9B774_ZYGMR|nr:uncharacterized protein HG535_0G03200 [Zygotorulaspora mrakii]QLG74437.1 hypothetical protein HG535_0G03200 [Zygotorulaspora mrakii]
MDYLRDKLQGDEKFRIDLSKNVTHPAFQYNRERCLPISQIFGHRGFFLFPSENSYDIFKNTKFNYGLLEPGGVGIPLFHIRKCYHLMSFSGRSPVFIIYKNIILHEKENVPFAKYNVIRKENGLVLYEVPYCEIYRRMGLLNKEYNLVFSFDGITTRQLLMIRRSYNRDLFTNINDTNLRWHVSYSPLKSDQFRLAILEDGAPSLLDDSETRRRKKSSDSSSGKRENRVIAHFTRRHKDYLPKIISKESNLIIGEWSDSPSYGISSIPWDTQALSCQALLIHYLEDEEEKRGSNQPAN